MIIIATFVIYNAQICFQGLTNNANFIFSVGFLHGQFTISIEQIKLVTLHTICSVVRIVVFTLWVLME